LICCCAVAKEWMLYDDGRKELAALQNYISNRNSRHVSS
jgi:hypothetical protein